MKINKIRLENFRWHRSLEVLDIPKMLLVYGGGASGKTSLLEGITYGLAGATKHTSSDGKGADVLVLDGEGRALVDMTVATETGDHTIKRSIPHALSVDGTNGGVKRTAELLKAILPLSPESYLMTFESSRILHMDDAKRRKYLSMVAGVGEPATYEELQENLTAWCATKGIEADSEDARLISLVVEVISHRNAAPYSELYKKAYEERRSMNAQIGALEKTVPEYVGETFENPESIYSYAVKHKNELEVELKLSKALNPEGKQGIAVILKKPDIKLINQKIDNLKSVISRETTALQTKQAKVNNLKAQIAQLESAAHQCPIFLRNCPLPKEETDGALEQVNTLISREEREIGPIQRRITNGQKAMEEALKELTKATTELTEYAEFWKDTDEKTFDNIRDEASILKEMATTQEKIEAASKYIAYKSLTEGMNNRPRLTQLQADLRIVGLVLEAMSPGGIQGMLLADSLPRLEELATEASRTITRGRYEITFSVVDGDLDISVISSGRKRPITTLSTSEEIWVSLVIQHIINSLTGNTILVIDEAATLDTTMQEGLQDFLLGVGNNYENIFICATTDREDFLPRLTGDQIKRVHLPSTHQEA